MSKYALIVMIQKNVKQESGSNDKDHPSREKVFLNLKVNLCFGFLSTLGEKMEEVNPPILHL